MAHYLEDMWWDDGCNEHPVWAWHTYTMNRVHPRPNIMRIHASASIQEEIEILYVHNFAEH